MDLETLPDSTLPLAKKIKVEDNPSDEELQQICDVTNKEFEVALKQIKKQDDNLNPVTEIKIERDFETEDKNDYSECKRNAAIPEIKNICVGEIKIEGDSYIKAESGKESSDNETDTADEAAISANIIYEEDSDDDDMVSGEEYSSSAVSKWNDEDEIPTTSRKIKKEKNSPVKKGKGLKIKEETNNESDSDQDDSDVPSDVEEEFLSDVASGEEFLSDGDENSSDNQNLTVDNQPLVIQLIDEYHKRPQLWFKELSAEMSDLKELQLFRSINNALNQKFNMKFSVNLVKKLLKSLCAQYEAEIERQLKENEETTVESSSLWFYDKLFFLKDDIESNVKTRLEKTLKVIFKEIKMEKRSPNFNATEVKFLLATVKKYRGIIACKKADRVKPKDKRKAWKDVEREFNDKFTQTFRTYKVLKTKYFNIKSTAKQKIAFDKRQTYKTSSGPKRKRASTQTRKAVLNICHQTQILGRPSKYDSDSVNTKESLNDDNDAVGGELAGVVAKKENDAGEKDTPHKKEKVKPKESSTDSWQKVVDAKLERQCLEIELLKEKHSLEIEKLRLEIEYLKLLMSKIKKVS